MTDYITNHYDLSENIARQMIVLDSFKDMARTINNDVIPASREDVVIAGIENPASALSSTGSVYTTLPLRPVSKDVNFLYKNYIHCRFNLNFTLNTTSDSAGTTAANLTQPLNVAISTVSTACLPSRIQLLCGNSIVWQNQFQRQESIAGFCSLPQEIVETSPEFMTCSKVLQKQSIPGAYFTLSTNPTNTGIHKLSFTLDTTIDLNHLTPLLSNIPFTTTETGDLRLRLFFENLEESFLLTATPTDAPTGLSSTNFHVISPQPMNKRFCIYQPTTQAIATASNTIAAGVTSTAIYIKCSLDDWSAVDFGCEIVQSNFSIKESSRDAIKNYIKSDNKIIIPSQTWSTALSTNKPSSSSGELVWQISAYNIYLLAFLFPYDSSWSCYYPTPPLTSIDIQLNSKSINYIPYKAIDSRVIKDTIQAFINDDRYGANESLANSLKLPLASNGSGYDASTYLSWFNYNTCKYDVLNPNCFILSKGLSPPNSFEKGYCYASSNPQSTQLRLKYQLQSGLETGANNTLNANQSLTSTNSGAYCLALQDCCLVLNYNPDINTAQSGSIIYAEPSVE